MVILRELLTDEEIHDLRLFVIHLDVEEMLEKNVKDITVEELHALGVYVMFKEGELLSVNALNELHLRSTRESKSIFR